MVILDAVAVIALMKDEPAADEVASLMSGPTSMSSVNYAEVIDHLQRIVNKDRDWIDLHLAPIMNTSLTVIAADSTVAEQAGSLRSAFYAARLRPISLADAFAIATAVESKAPLATSDPAIADILRLLSHDVIALPDSQGSRP